MMKILTKRFYRDKYEEVFITLGTLREKFVGFCSFLSFYLRKKTLVLYSSFEKNKNILVRLFMMKRGRYSRPFLHIAALTVLVLGILLAPFLADTYPVFSSNTNPAVVLASEQTQKQSITVDENVFQTDIATKNRGNVITYTVEKGDTISTIAKKFDISEDTIRWENSLATDDLSIGDSLKILPVTGIAHKVEKGESIYTIAKKYSADAQSIVDFPTNDFVNPETFSLVEGQILIVPGGTVPSEKPVTARQQVEIAGGTVPVSHGGWFFPVSGLITQYASWYHMALDIAGSVGTPVYAAHSGTVIRVSVGTYDMGYGTNIWINDGDGIETHYAHLNTVNVGAGQAVIGGQSVIGTRGNTGRSTGPHTHFEIQVNGRLVNPLSYVSP